MEPARRWDQVEGGDPICRVMVADDSFMLCERLGRLPPEHDVG